MYFQGPHLKFRDLCEALLMIGTFEKSGILRCIGPLHCHYASYDAEISLEEAQTCDKEIKTRAPSGLTPRYGEKLEAQT